MSSRPHQQKRYTKGRNTTLRAPTQIHGRKKTCWTLFWFKLYQPSQTTFDNNDTSFTIDKLIIVCNDIDCMTKKIQELNGSVEPDPKGDKRLQQRITTLILRAKSEKQCNYDYKFGKKGEW